MIDALKRDSDLRNNIVGLIASIVCVLAANGIVSPTPGYVAVGAWFATGLTRVLEGRKIGWTGVVGSLLFIHMIDEAHAPHFTHTTLIVSAVIFAYALYVGIGAVILHRRSLRAE